MDNLAHIIKPFNESLSLLFLCCMLVIISFFSLFLLLFILRMSSEWRKEGWALAMIFILVSFIIFQVVIFLRRRKVLKAGEDAVLSFVSNENSKCYEQKHANLTATLFIAQIELNLHKVYD